MNSIKKSSKINLLFVTNSLKRRGAEQQLFNFIKELPENFDISIYRFSNDDREFPELFRYEKVKIYSNKHIGTFNFFKFKSLYGCISDRNFDVIITLGLGAALFLGRLCAILKRVKIVYSILNTYENFNKLPLKRNNYFDIFNKVINSIIPFLPGERSFRFLPNSQKLAERIKKCEDRYSIIVFYNGISKNELEKNLSRHPDHKTKDIQRRLNGFPTIVQVGALDETKNQQFSLGCLDEIKSKIPNVRFLLIGKGCDRNKLSSLVSTKGWENHVIFAGHLNMIDCLYLIKHSTLLVLTSLSESFPNVLLEGQALAKPVVTFDVGAASEIVKNGITGFVIAKGDRSEFIRSATQILINSSLANKMGTEGMNRALTIFSMRRKVNHFISMAEKDLSMFR